MAFASTTNDTLVRDVVAAVGEGIIAIDDAGEVVFANDGIERLLGYEPTEVVERPIDRFVPAERPHETLSRLAEQDGSEARLTFRHADGHDVPAAVTARTVEDDGDRVLVVAARSVEDRSPLAVDGDGERLRKVFEHSHDAILIIDPEGDTIADCNPRACELLGYSREELLAQAPSDIHPHEVSKFREFVGSVLEEGDGWTDELSCYTCEDEIVPAEISASAIEIDGCPHVLAFVRDISERREREREVHRRSAAMEAARDGMAILDEDGTFIYVNGAFADVHGYDGRGALVGETWERCYDEPEAKRIRWDVLPTVWNEGSWRGEITGTRPDGTTFPAEATLTELEDGGMVWIVRDITRRKERERRLESLTEVARELMRADTRGEIAGIAARSVGELLGYEVACVRLLDDETEELERAALTDAAGDLVESRTAYDLEATHAGRAFRAGETIVNVRDDELGGAGHSSLHVPLGERGTLTVIDRSGAAFEDRHVDVAEILAVTVETAIARAEQERRLREQRHELRQQRDDLETLNRINTLIREIGEHLAQAGGRDELERLICRQLSDADLYLSTWIASVDVTENSIDPHACEGIDSDYLDAVGEMDVSEVGDGAVAAAIETSEVQVVRTYQVTESAGPTAANFGEESDRLEATAAIPLTYQERVHSVLVVNGAREELFSSEAVAGFESLGRMVGFAIDAVSTRELLLSDTVVELEFEVSDPSDLYTRVSGELDCTCRFERSVPREGGRGLEYLVVEGAAPEAVVEAAEAADGIAEATVVAERGDGIVVQALAERSPAGLALEAGATVQSLVAEGGTARVTVEAPTDADLREIAAVYEEVYESVAVAAKREVERSLRTVEEFREAIDEGLTEKQRSALEAAYTTGYYDWPREVTAEELAGSMDIAAATLHQHLRNGERKLLAAFLED